MFERVSERVYRLVAEALPARLAYWTFRRVVAEASLTVFRDLPASEARALEALKHWHDSQVDRGRTARRAAAAELRRKQLEARRLEREMRRTAAQRRAPTGRVWQATSDHGDYGPRAAPITADDAPIPPRAH
jgi:hypothetical protein